MRGGAPKKKRGGGIIRVGSLFEKYRTTLIAPEKSVITAFIHTLEEVLPGVSVMPHQCAYTPQTKTLTLRVQGALKSEILLRKEQILKDMETVLGRKSAPINIL